MSAATPLTVGFLPWWPHNPYQVLLKRELNALGMRVVGNPPLSLLRILLGRDGLDVVHVHWPHGLYKTTGQFLHALSVLVAYRLRRNNIVWTVHELEAYESSHPRRDDWFRAVVMRLARRLVVHGKATQGELANRYAYPRPIDLALHASYIGWYRDEVSAPQARVRLGLPAEARVFLYFGYIKPYKGVEDLLHAFRALDDPQAVLLVVGRPLDADIEHKVRDLAVADPRVRTVLGYVPDDDVQLYFRAADVVVLPFRRTQTSGSLMLAMSFGRAIVAPAIATLPEYIDADSAIFFDPDDPQALAAALRRAAAADTERLGARALQRAESFTWSAMAQVHADAYRAVVGR